MMSPCCLCRLYRIFIWSLGPKRSVINSSPPVICTLVILLLLTYLLIHLINYSSTTMCCSAAAARGLLPNIPLFHRQTSSSSMGDNLPAMGPVRRPSHSTRTPGSSSSSRPSNPAARRRWRKIRFAVAFICKAKIPDGPKGEMCRSVQDDVDFGRFFLMGTNTSALRRCSRVPDNFAVTDRDVEGYLSPGKTLDEAAAVRQLYQWRIQRGRGAPPLAHIF